MAIAARRLCSASERADNICVKRVLFVLGAGIAVGASYWAVLVGEGSHPGWDSGTMAAIFLPGLVAALILAVYIASDLQRDRRTSGTVSDLSAQLVRRELEIDRLSTLDELTGLYTRHHFDENVHLEFKRAARYLRPVSLLLIEIDDLAEVGENVGKLSQGYLLSEVGAILRTMLRANDVGCRFSNDTLAALLPETDTAALQIVADRVRKLVREHEFLGQKHGDGLRLTVSQGAAVVPAEGIESEKDFLRAAELAVAAARTAGFDQVRVHAVETERAAPQDADEAQRLAS